MLYPLDEAERSGGDLRNVGGPDMYVKDIMFRLAAKRLSGKKSVYIQGIPVISSMKII